MSNFKCPNVYMNKKSIFIEKDDLVGVKQNVLYNGLLNNKNVYIIDNIEECDYIFIDIIRDFDKIKRYSEEQLKKVIIIDYRDNSKEVSKIPCLKYFKRSVVDKNTMKIIDYNREIIPISYSLKQEVLEFKDIYEYHRNIDISVFFTPGINAINNNTVTGYRSKVANFIKKNFSNYNIFVGIYEYHRNIDISVFFTPGINAINNNTVTGYRSKVANFIKKNFSNYNIFVGICGNNGVIGRTTIQKDYYNKMFHSKIVVTCNPDNWEGDYRTWEALSTGALTFVDNMKTPIINPLINEKHVIFYNRNNLLELKKKILFYLKTPDLAKKISHEGNTYALKYHKPSDRISEILSQLNYTE